MYWQASIFLRTSLTALITVTCLLSDSPAQDAPAETTVLEQLQQRLDAQDVELAAMRKFLEEREAAKIFTSSTETPSAIKFVNQDDDGVPIADVLSGLSDRIDKSAQPGTSKSTMKVVGRVHADYWGFPEDSPAVNAFENEGDTTTTPQDRLGFRRIRFGVRGNVSPNMEYRIELELAEGNNSEYRDAWLGFHDLGFLQTVLIGNQKRPYGLDHLNSSRYNVFIERPFIIESFNQDCRRLGVTSYGLSDDQAWNWRYGVYNQRLIQDESSHVNDHLQLELAGRLANTYIYEDDGATHAHWAISGTVAHPDGSAANNSQQDNEARFRHRPEARSNSRWLDTGRIAGADWYNLLGFESLLNFGPLQLVGEYQNTWMQRDSGSGGDLFFFGGYAYVSYFLTGENMAWSRKSGTLGRVKPNENFFMAPDGSAGGWGAWQVAFRYSYADFTDREITGGIGESCTFGMNWHWNTNARMQFNYIKGTIDERPATVNGPGGNIGGDYGIIGMRFMIDF